MRAKCVLMAMIGPVLLLGGCSRQKPHLDLSGLRNPSGRQCTATLPGAAGPRGLEADPWDSSGSSTEVWIIAKASVPARAPSEAGPRQGELRARIESKDIPLPLRHTDVKVRVSAFIAAVDVTQQFHNPYDTKIEALYVFPLPEDAAVTDFVMTIGERRIRGLVRERKEAEELYAAAKAQGYRAALLTQERPNIFTQSVANIEPGKEIDVQISYFSPLAYHDGEYELVFPMVVGPRFNPPGQSDGVGAVGRGRRDVSGQETEIEYLKPGERSGHDIALAVEIDAGVAIEDVRSCTHAVDVDRRDETRVRVSLRENDAIPNKDFVLRYKVAGKRVQTAMLVQRGENGNTFALVLQPPESLVALPRTPREMVFVLDCSGSMCGAPIAQAKLAIKRCLRNLAPNDTFQVISFSESASRLGADPVPATPSSIECALAYVDGLECGGGTMMLSGIRAALDFPHDSNRLRLVSFMTDGYIGNEAEILAAIKKRLGAARIFSFGVGTSVNRYLLERMAALGRGAVAYVGLNDSATEAVDQFYERVAHPALTDIRIDWGGMAVTEVYPRAIPDLFAGRPILLLGRFEGHGRTSIRVVGRSGRTESAYDIPVDLDAAGAEHAAVTSMWGRWKIRELSDAEIVNPDAELKEAILHTALGCNLLCRYTAFLAVDSREQTAGGHGVSVRVPVPVPDGVRYDTAVEP